MFVELKEDNESYGFTVVSFPFSRPWGSFLVIEEAQVQEFSNKFSKA